MWWSETEITRWILHAEVGPGQGEDELLPALNSLLALLLPMLELGVNRTESTNTRVDQPEEEATF
jgi:hypothetical protein